MPLRPSAASLAVALTAALSAAAVGPGVPPAAADPLDDALAVEGLRRADLGWEPRGYWSRFPADIPYRMRHFDALLAQPLATIPFARSAATAARTLLSADELARTPEASDGALYRAVQRLGVDPMFGAFRGYSANLDTARVDLVEAILAATRRAGRPTEYRTFGKRADYPDLRADLEARAAAVPEAWRAPLGRLVLDLVDADEWVALAFRRVDPAARLEVQRRRDLGAGLTDALEYVAAFDDVAADLDEPSLWYGGLRAVAAAERAVHALREVAATDPAPDLSFDWPAPQGWIRVRGGGADRIPGGDAFLLVDLGGDDRWTGAVGAPDPGRGLSVAIDLAGNDRWEGGDAPTQGAGLAGVGVLIDAAGDDSYTADRCAQGFGRIGLGVLADLAGRDRYDCRFSGQGAAFLGIGVLLEAAGDDSYRIQSDGQGFGGAGGVGTLADRSGDDRYEAVRDPAVTGRPSYHSEMRVSVSNAQGVGSGRRGDGGDGHSWAGGLGQLLDSEGDDEYVAGNWAQGTGYWFGTGILHDGAGRDTYRSVVWSQGSGAHFCVGALIDEEGDDRHLIEEKGSASLAFGHDFTVALLLDAAGDDRYEIPEGDGLGYSINRSVAMLLDGGGGDAYLGKPGNRPGTARADARFADHDGSYTYFAEASSLGLFLDVGGEDDYGIEGVANDSVWVDPPDSPNRADRNLSIGADVPAGDLDLRAAPERAPSGAD